MRYQEDNHRFTKKRTLLIYHYFECLQQNTCLEVIEPMARLEGS